MVKLEKSVSSGHPRVFSEPFGVSCKPSKPDSGKDRSVGNRGPDKPVPIAALLGAPIALVTIRNYGRGWNKPDDVLKYVADLLETQTGEVYPYPPWDEAVFADIIATVQFSDHRESALEVSGVHVCFSTYSGSAVWLRVFRSK
jgi:hypothetical protein